MGLVKAIPFIHAPHAFKRAQKLIMWGSIDLNRPHAPQKLFPKRGLKDDPLFRRS
jgi:hypothetical protein